MAERRTASLQTGAMQRWLPAFVAAIVLALLGWPTLSVPLNGDTALFHLGAARLLDGDALYAQWWDLKTPGVYLVHMAARGLFGGQEMAIHGLGLVCASVAGACTALALANHVSSATLRAVAGILVAAPYLLAAGSWHLSQPAYFAGLALLLGVLGTSSGHRPASLTGGVALAVAATIKLSAIAPAIAMLFLARRPMTSAIGVIVTLIAVGLWLGITGGLADAWHTLTSWRSQADQVLPGATASHLPEAARWYLEHHPILVLAAALAILIGLFQPAHRSALIATGRLAIVIVAALVGIVAERFAGWPFDFFLVSPLLALAAIGLLARALDALPTGQWRAAAAVLAGALILAPALPAWWHAQTASRAPTALRSAAQFVDRLPPGPIYVFGDPQILLVSGRAMAGSVHGWAWELQPPEMAERLLRDWQHSPPGAILASAHYRQSIEARHPSLWGWITTHYRQLPEQPLWWLPIQDSDLQVRPAS